MRGHGFTAVGESIEETVFRAIYTAENATIQTTAMTISATARGSKCQDKDVYYLQDSELHDTTEMTKWSVMRPWGLWVREVEANGLYTNLA
jgi:ribulose-5-phosphate 4-epimerase/fuculose-1-phosphate aldolase